MILFKKSFSFQFRLLLAIGIFSLFLFTGCSSKFEKLPESAVDTEMKQTAASIGKNILVSQKEGRFEPLGEEATEAMRAAFTPEEQRKGYLQLKSLFGEFESMEYVETYVPKQGSKLFICRFRGKFSKNKNVEVRVVMNEEGKLDGFWLKPWKKKI